MNTVEIVFKLMTCHVVEMDRDENVNFDRSLFTSHYFFGRLLPCVKTNLRQLPRIPISIESEYGIIGEGSQIPTNQMRESTVFSLTIG